MVPYKLLVIHWSIFTLSMQLVYCASLHSTSDPSSLPLAAPVSLGSPIHSLGRGWLSQPAQTPSMTTSPTFKSAIPPAHQSLCNVDSEQHLGKGRESSITLLLEPNRIQIGPCKRAFIAPEMHGFIVKVVRSTEKHIRNNPNSNIDTDAGGVSDDVVYNQTTTCPLVITSGKDPLLPPWRIDPCQLEARGISRETVRLMQGRLRISWTPNHHSPKYKVVITAFAKGFHCKQGHHPCLKFGEETLFCVSSALVCDGVNHCPSGDEYFSDEDAVMCARHKAITATNTSNGLTLWQQITKEFFNKVYPSEMQPGIPAPPRSADRPHTTTHKSSNEADDSNDGSIADESDDTMETTTKRYRVALTRGLSKYGPWGYLMVGMLLCGGALLLCVLWEMLYNGAHLLATSNQSTFLGTSTNSNLNGSTSNADSSMPPNYDEIDPPPSYSTLFPGKSIEAAAAPTTNESAMQVGEAAAALPAGSTSQLPMPTVFILPVADVAPSSTTTSRSGT